MAITNFRYFIWCLLIFIGCTESKVIGPIDPIAIEWYKKAQDKHNMARSLNKKDLLKEALESTNAALRVDSNFEDAYHTKIVILEELGREKEALKLVRELLANKEMKGNFNLTAGVCFMLNEMPDSAAPYLKAALSETPDTSSTAIVFRASILRILSGPDAAVSELKKIDLQKLTDEEKAPLQRIKNEFLSTYPYSMFIRSFTEPEISFCIERKGSENIDNKFVYKGVNIYRTVVSGEDYKRLVVPKRFEEAALRAGLKKCGEGESELID